MEIPRFRLFAQTLHCLESGDVDPNEVKRVGWAHALINARIKRIGRSYEEIISDFKKYAEVKELEKEKATKSDVR